MQADSAPERLCGFEDVTSFVSNFRSSNITFKEKAHFRRLSTGLAKRLRLDPSAVKEDLAITMYYEHTQALMPDDCEQILVCIPFEDEIERIHDRFQVLHKYIVVSGKAC